MLRNCVLLTLAVLGLGGAQAWADSTKRDAETLRSVSLLYRHSVISPKYSPPKVKTEWPMGWMQLTAVGMREMYQKGQELRHKYVDRLGLISGGYKGSEIYVRASNTDRALQTAQLLMLGLYPLGTGPDPAVYDASMEAVPAPQLAFTPVPIHAVALKNDAVLRPWTGKAGCKAYRKYVKQLPNTDLYRKQGSEHQDFLEHITAVTGFNEGEEAGKILYQVNEIYEPLSAHVQHNIPLPQGISEADLRKMRDLADWNYHHQFLGRRVGLVTGGPFIGEIVDNMREVVTAGPNARKLYIYSAHQRTLLGVEAALGIETARTKGPLFSGRVPPLASHYAFELHETGKGAFAMRLKFVSDGAEQVITVPGCDGPMCPLENFVKAVSRVIPGDWRKACKA
jgi:acid phosphatase